MREKNSNKIKKTVLILLAVFFVIAVTAASASACTSKVKDDKCKSSHKEKVAKEKPVAKETPAPVVDQKAAQEKLGNQLLDMVENNWFGSGSGSNDDGGWGGDLGDGWSGDDWGDD
jgi:hypothetical protein